MSGTAEAAGQFVSRAAAQRFYARHGFARAGERRFFFPSGLEGELDYILIRPAQPP